MLDARAADPAAVAELAALIGPAESPALVVGSGADDPESWAALVKLAERLGCPVWQESFGARAGFPQDHPLFAGHLPAGRARLRDALVGHDAVLAVGAPIFRQYPFEPGRLLGEGTRAALITDDPAEAHRSPAELVLLAAPAAVCEALARELPARDAPAPPSFERPPAPAPPAAGEPLRAAHVLAALAERLPADAVLIEEAPSNRPELLARIPARRSLGFLSPAMGGLGFGLPGGDRGADGAPRSARGRGRRGRILDVRDPIALERRPLRGRRALRRPRQRRLPGNGPARRGPGGGGAVAGLRVDRDRGDRARPRLRRAHRH